MSIANRVLAVLIVFAAGCNFDPSTCSVCQSRGHSSQEEEGTGPLVNLRIIGDENIAAFDAIVSQVTAAGIHATVLAGPDFAAEQCETLRALHEEGIEIAAFVQPEPQDGQEVSLSTLTHQEQEDLIKAARSEIENCIGASIGAVHFADFDENEDTYEIVSTLGFDYNLGFVARTDRCLAGHEDDTLPYQSDEYGFWAVPMHSVSFDGQWIALCDDLFVDRTSAAEWRQLLEGELDYAREQGRPLTVEVRASVTGVDPDRLAAFTGFLDRAAQQEARFVTVAELVAWSQTPAGEGGCGCQ